MLRFKGKDLQPVLKEAINNGGAVLFAKDQGVYMFSAECERDADNNPKNLAYAEGCNPNLDKFDDWWTLSRAELGGDDFGEEFDPNDNVFQAVLAYGHDLTITATSTHLTLEAEVPRDENAQTRKAQP